MIVFLVPYPVGEAPSQRFRFEQYFELLKSKNIHFEVYSFLSPAGWSVLYANGKFFQKIGHLIRGFVVRFFHVFYARSANYVFIHREVTPVGPPVFEWILAKLLRRKIIYDFDDAIWMTDNQQESSFEKVLRSRSKVSIICHWSYKVSCGNEYLCAYAKRFTNHVVLNPTTIDTEGLHNPEIYDTTSNNTIVRIGWTGSHSTLKYLHPLTNVLKRIEKEFTNTKITIIANRTLDLGLQSMEFIPWRKETEPEDLLKIDIGIMPLPDDEWTKGKCGFKALQYMAMGIPTVVSPVGVNTLIIKDSKNGFLARTDDDWYNYLSQLITQPLLRKKIGQEGRSEVIKHYSVLSNSDNFLLLFT